MAFREEDTNTADTAADSNATVQLQGERNNITIGRGAWRLKDNSIPRYFREGQDWG